MNGMWSDRSNIIEWKCNACDIRRGKMKEIDIKEI
jgi:hypothetical protein